MSLTAKELQAELLESVFSAPKKTFPTTLDYHLVKEGLMSEENRDRVRAVGLKTISTNEELEKEILLDENASKADKEQALSNIRVRMMLKDQGKIGEEKRELLLANT